MISKFNYLVACCAVVLVWSTSAQASPEHMKGWLIDASSLSNLEPEPFKSAGLKQCVVSVTKSPTQQQSESIDRLKKEGLEIWYWIEIARDAAMAEKHPEWMSSIQGHHEWRRFHPGFPEEKIEEIVKVFPWVPVFYAEAFDAHLEKVKRLVESWPVAKGIFLNNIQGAPTACGCGHPLCRWTTDYGPKKTAQNLGHDAPAKFVQRIKDTYTDLACIPVWATECEAHDKDSLCAGVGCYNGACWREWSKQLQPVVETTSHIATLLTYKELQRDLDIYGETAAWIPKAIASFAKETTRFQRRAVPPEQLIGILQGWDVSQEEIAAQIKQLGKAKTHGYLLSKIRINSTWEPRIIPLTESE